MTTRAEEIAGEGPYTVERIRLAKGRDWWTVTGPDAGGIPAMDHVTAKDLCDRLNAAYKQGQQDRWIPVEKRTPDLPIEAAGSRFSERVLVYRSLAPKHMQVGEATYADFGPMDKGWMGESGNGITHWMPLPEKPEQR